MGFMKTAFVGVLIACAINVLPTFFKQKLPPVGSGSTAPGWERVGDVFRKHIDEGLEPGAAFSVYYKGKLVVEYTGGYADPEGGRPWDDKILSIAFSSTKGVTAIIMAMLVDRGLLDYDKPIAHYWPEFAQNGKEKITVRHLMSHQAGVSGVDEEFTIYEMVENNDKVSRILAKQKPYWKIGEGFGYHAFTIGMYADQIIRRVDPKHRDIGQFFKEEVARPFDIDFFIGLPLEENHRHARIVHERPLEMFTPTYFDLEILKMYWNYMTTGSELIKKYSIAPSTKPVELTHAMNNPAARAVPCGATRGFGTATGLAKLYGIVANGGEHNGKRLLSQKAIHSMLTEVISGKDKILALDFAYANGMSLIDSTLGSRMFGTPGHGGQMGYGDVTHKVGWAYITNHLKPALPGKDPRYIPLEQAIYDVIRDLEK